MKKHGGFPYRAHRCEYCQKLAVTFPHGKALCASHASDPDSEVYIVKLEQIKTKYLQHYSASSWDEFCHRTFEADGKNYEDFTWQEISQAAQDELFRQQYAGDNDYAELQRDQTELRGAI